MSKFTGREPAVYSEFTMFGEPNKTIEEQLANTVIHYNDEILDIKTERELVPYYANMCGIVCATNENGKVKKSIHITSVPYFLSQDWEWTERMYKQIQSIWRKCKRNNIKFTIEYVKEHFWRDEEPDLEKIVKEIAEHPYAKYVKGKFHSNWMQRYRDLLIEEMRKYNYTEEQINEWVWNGRRTW